MSVKSAVRVPSWEELNAMSYEELRELYKEHQDVLRKPLAESESVASLHALSLTTGVEIEKDELYSAVRQAITDGSANPSLAKDALLEDPVTFSRVRRFNTGTDLFGRGEFIEQLYVFPNSKVRTFHIISKDPKRAQMIAAKQRMLRKLKDYITSNGATEAKNLLEGLLARDPIYETPTSVHSLFLDATDLKTALRSADLEGRMRTISETTKYDLMLNSYSQRFLETKEGKRAATLGGTWRTLWRGTNLLEEKDESRSLLEEIILPADRTTTEQLRQKGAVDANGRLLNGTPLWLYETPNIAGVLSLLGVRPGKPGLEKAGFSMGDLNPGNVMVYADGRQEFIDHENACLDPATSMLAQRWIRAGVYKENGDAQTVNGVDAEKRLLDESYSHYSGLPGEKLGRGAFESEFRRHKAGFLLRLARRYKKYEEIDTNPVRMGQLKRYYYSWFAKELKNQRKIDGINDHKLDYLNSLFEKPLDDAGMEEVFRNSDPAFSYRSELSPSAMGLKKRMETEVESRYSSYKRKKRRNGIVKTAVAGIVGAGMILFGGSAYKTYSQNKEFRQMIERIRVELNDKEATLKQGEAESEMKDRYENVKQYYMYKSPSDSVEWLARHRIRALVDRFYPQRDPQLWNGEIWDPENREERQRHPQWQGSLLTAFAVYLDRETAIEGLLATHCTDWHCELGEWFYNKGDGVTKTRIKKFRQEHPDCKDVPMSLFHNRYSNIHSYVASLIGVGAIDGWSLHPEPTFREKLKEQTRFIEHPVFGQGHRCKLYSKGHPNDEKPKNQDFYGWPR